MIGQITLTGMVLNAANVGEYDKRISILTKERGKITAFSKGSRRQNSSLLACSQPFSFGTFVLYEGRSSYTLVSAEISNYFMELRDDFEKVSYGMYFLEFVDYYTKENSDEKEVLKLLYQSCRALISDTISNELVKCIFELKMFAINGEITPLRECAACGARDNLKGISVDAGAAVCECCTETIRDTMIVSKSTLYTMQYVIYSSIEKLYSFVVTDEVLVEFNRFLKRYINKYIDKKFKTLDMLVAFK